MYPAFADKPESSQPGNQICNYVCDNESDDNLWIKNEIVIFL